MIECGGWTFTFGDITLKTDTVARFMDTLAFARILGYMTNDGGIYHNASRQMYHGIINL